MALGFAYISIVASSGLELAGFPDLNFCQQSYHALDRSFPEQEILERGDPSLFKEYSSRILYSPLVKTVLATSRILSIVHDSLEL